MTTGFKPLPLLKGLQKQDYNVDSLDDEIRVDQLCVDLLRRFNQDLTRKQGMQPERAGEICHGADYFLREFIIGDRKENLFEITDNRVRQFAGHWYIIRTPEPNLVELKSILNGTAAFYCYLAEQGLFKASQANEITARCKELEYYQQRINDFWSIEDDGFESWRQECPLEPVPEIS